MLGIEAPAGEFPNAAEAEIINCIPEPIRPSCHPAEQIYTEEVDTVRCDGATEHPPIDYSLFETEGRDGRRVRERRRPRGRRRRRPTGAAPRAATPRRTRSTGAPAGQILCTLYDAPDGKEYKVIEWTNDNRNILTYHVERDADLG